MYTKDFPVKVKAVGESDGLQPGQFEAIVSVFGNEDSYGDVVAPGAFTEDIERWKASGDPQPCIWAHDWGDPFSHIGYALDSKETDVGWWVKGQVDIDAGNAKADWVYRLLKGRRVKQFSFAYDIDEGGWVDVKDHRFGGYYELRKMTTFEFGPCLIGANRETDLLAAKAHDLTRGIKAGRVLSQTNYDRLTKARDSITAVLDAATPEDAKQPASQPASGAASGGDPAREPDAPPAKHDGRSAQAAARLTLMTALNGD